MGEQQCPAARTGIPGYCYRGGGRAVPGLPRFIPSSCTATSRVSSLPSRRGSVNMTTWLRSVPLCVLLYSALALCAQDHGAGELRLIRANYCRSRQLPCILYLVERSLRIVTSRPTHLCSLHGVHTAFSLMNGSFVSALSPLKMFNFLSLYPSQK